LNPFKTWLLLSPDGDDSGGDAGGSSYSGGDGGDTGGDSPQAESTPEPISFKPGDSFLMEGSDKPIVWGQNGPEGFIPQSEYTKKRQAETAELQQARAALNQERAQLQTWQRTMMERAAAARNGQQQGQPNPLDKIYAAAEARGGWVHVNDMRGAMDAQNTRLSQLEGMIRDTGGTIQHLVAGQQHNVAAQKADDERRADGDLDILAGSIIDQSPVLQSADRGESLRILREVFDAYQMRPGETRETFMQALTEMANNRVTSMVNLVQGHQKNTRDTARRARIPGPNSSPMLTGDGKPIIDSQELADKLWSRLGGGGPR